MGASNLAFPQLNRISFFSWVKGVGAFLVAGLFGGPESLLSINGWQTPSVSSFFSTLAVLLLTISAVSLGVNLVVTIHNNRTPGLLWKNLSLTLWSMYVTGLLLVLSAPLMFGSALLGFSGASWGSLPVVAALLSGFVIRTALFAGLIPAVGIVSDIFATFSRRPHFGYNSMIVSLFGLAGLSLVGWNATNPLNGQSPAVAAFSAISFMFVLFPITNIIFCWIATLISGKTVFNTSVIAALSSACILIIATTASAAFGHMGISSLLQNTTYTSGVLHLYAGSVLLALLAGLHFWWPKFSGKCYNDLWSVFSIAFITSGVLVSFVAMLFSGSQGLQSGSAFVGNIRGLVGLVPAGGLFTLLGFGMVIFNLWSSQKKGAGSPSNPWNAVTLEWQTQSPPPAQNFTSTPEVSSKNGPYDFATENA